MLQISFFKARYNSSQQEKHLTLHDNHFIDKIQCIKLLQNLTSINTKITNIQSIINVRSCTLLCFRFYTIKIADIFLTRQPAGRARL